VAPKAGKAGKRFLEHLPYTNAATNLEFMRLALKLATSAGRTTVMAMLIPLQIVPPRAVSSHGIGGVGNL
jgi:type III restriction enzyme